MVEADFFMPLALDYWECYPLKMRDQWVWFFNFKENIRFVFVARLYFECRYGNNFTQMYLDVNCAINESFIGYFIKNWVTKNIFAVMVKLIKWLVWTYLL